MSNEFRRDHELMSSGLRMTLQESRESVVSAVESMFLDFSKERTDFSAVRRAMVHDLKSGLVDARVNRTATVLEIRDDASEMSRQFRQKHELMSKDLRRSLVESKQSVGAFVAALLVDFSRERNDYSKALRRTAKAQAVSLAKDRRARSHAVFQLMRSFTKEHRHMTKIQRAGLVKCRRARSQALVQLIQSFHGEIERGVLRHSKVPSPKFELNVSPSLGTPDTVSAIAPVVGIHGLNAVPAIAIEVEKISTVKVPEPPVATVSADLDSLTSISTNSIDPVLLPDATHSLTLTAPASHEPEVLKQLDASSAVVGRDALKGQSVGEVRPWPSVPLRVESVESVAKKAPAKVVSPKVGTDTLKPKKSRTRAK
jgi:hypothetical protein